MASITANSNNQRKITSAAAERRAEVSWVATSRGAWTRTKHSTATMMIACEDRSNGMPKKTMVRYRESTATAAGTTAWIVASIAIRKLCLYKTGWVIGYPLDGQHLPGLRVAKVLHKQTRLSAKPIYSYVT